MKLLQSREEYEASVCLCGSHVCRGSYLNLTGEGAFQKVLLQRHCIYHLNMMICCVLVSFKEKEIWKWSSWSLIEILGLPQSWTNDLLDYLLQACCLHSCFSLGEILNSWLHSYDCILQQVLKECHGILDRHQLMLEACELNSVSEDDYIDLGKAGLGSCLLGGLPDWLIAYSARLVYIYDTWLPSFRNFFTVFFFLILVFSPEGEVYQLWKGQASSWDFEA